MAVHIASLNVDGLHDPPKRQALFDLFLNSNYDVICLQETHVQARDIQPWSKEWPYYSEWNPGPSEFSCGVGILVNGRKNITPIDVTKQGGGRVLTLKFQYNNIQFQVVNIYGHNDAKLRDTFHSNLSSCIFDDVPLILCGDFNMVENPKLDRAGGTPYSTHTQGITELDKLKTQYDLHDPWRNMKWERVGVWLKKSRIFDWETWDQSPLRHLKKLIL